ncbi:MAG: carboxypeptidase-like regulatory domain-containing protein [Bacteroidia bacterium]
MSYTLFRAFGPLLLLLWAGAARSQSAPAYWLDERFDGLSWAQFVPVLEQTYRLRVYHVGVPDSATIHVAGDSLPLLAVLRSGLAAYGLHVSLDGVGHVFVGRDSIATDLPAAFFRPPPQPSPVAAADTGEHFLPASQSLPPARLVVGQAGRGGSKTTLSGYLKSIEDGTPVGGAGVLLLEAERGALSNQQGFFSIAAPPGSYTLVVRSLHFKEMTYVLDLRSSGDIELMLEPRLVELEGVLVTAEQDNPIQNTQMGFERLSVGRIKEIPAIAGERDVLRAAQLLPGVQSVGEGAAGFNVRGSPADQNMFYINQVPIYNTSHLFGFFSAFHPDAVGSFSLAKGNIPARYGGRLASVFELTARQGNRLRYTASGGISPIAGRVLVEGPLQRDRSSFLLALRSTYSDWMLGLLREPAYRNSSARFADGLVNLAFEAGPRNQVHLFGYHSTDRVSFAGTTDYAYENTGASAAWSHFFRNKHHADLSLIYSRLAQDIRQAELPLAAYRQTHALEHREVRASVTLRPSPEHLIQVGVNSILYHNERGDFVPLDSASQLRPVQLAPEQGIESGLFISEDWTPVDRFSLSAGLRYNHYTYLGPQAVLRYRDVLLLAASTVLDTLYFGRGANIRTHGGLDVRAALRYLLSDDLSLKASVNRLHQYAFLLSNTIALAPSDKWKLSDYHIRPMVGTQHALGLYTNLLGDRLTGSAEVYYKQVQHLVEFRDGAELLVNAHPEQDILQGDLDAWGVEFMLNKPYGRLNGWVNYTYARAIVQVLGATPALSVNQGRPYPANYDKPHALNVVGNYAFSRRLRVSANVVYATGRPVTYPVARYTQQGIPLVAYSERNAYRVPDYFRIDLSATVEGSLKARKLLHGTWVFSIYNLLGRNNAYSVYFEASPRGITGYKVSIFGSPIFSVGYDFKFGNYAS